MIIEAPSQKASNYDARASLLQGGIAELLEAGDPLTILTEQTSRFQQITIDLANAYTRQGAEAAAHFETCTAVDIYAVFSSLRRDMDRMKAGEAPNISRLSYGLALLGLGVKGLVDTYELNFGQLPDA